MNIHSSDFLNQFERLHGLKAYYALEQMRKNGHPYKKEIVLSKFADNSFWTRDSAVHVVAKKSKQLMI